MDRSGFLTQMEKAYLEKRRANPKMLCEVKLPDSVFTYDA